MTDPLPAPEPARSSATGSRSGERRGTIQSVERAARILKVLGTGTSRMGVTDIAERLGLAKGTAYGLLRTLEAQELVEQDPETDKYRLGPAMLQLGNAFLDNHELRARSLALGGLARLASGRGGARRACCTGRTC